MRFLTSPAWTLRGAIALCVVACGAAYAQNPSVDQLKGKIFDAHMAQQTLGKGLRFCDRLNGKGFYFHLRDRVLDLEEYFQSLENLAKAEVYNPAKHRPWSLQDAKERWEEVKKQAAADKAKCELVKSLPQLEKQLQALQASSTGPDKKD